MTSSPPANRCARWKRWSNTPAARSSGRMAILAEGEAADRRDDIIYLEKLPLFKSDGTPIA